MSLFFTSRLLKVEQTKNDKGEVGNRLVFQSERYDKGMEQIVPCSQNIKLHEDDFKYIHVFETYIGKTISVPVTASTMKNGFEVFYKTTGEGLKLFEDVTTKSQAKAG